MEDSILTSVKKVLGIPEEYTHFDTDIIMHINSTFMVLNQLGVGPSKGFQIEDATSTWNDFLSDAIELNAVKSYVPLKVRLLFDPPTSSTVMECTKQAIAEFECRLMIQAESNLT